MTAIVATKGAVLAGCRIGPLWIGASGSQPIDDASWAEYVGLLERDLRINGPHAAELVWTPDHGANAKQRKVLTDKGEQLHIESIRRLAFVSDSVLVRGVFTAFSWIVRGVEMKAYSRHDVDIALGWLAQEARFDLAEASRAHDALVKVVSAPVMARAAGAR